MARQYHLKRNLPDFSSLPEQGLSCARMVVRAVQFLLLCSHWEYHASEVHGLACYCHQSSDPALPKTQNTTYEDNEYNTAYFSFPPLTTSHVINQCYTQTSSFRGNFTPIVNQISQIAFFSAALCCNISISF